MTNAHAGHEHPEGPSGMTCRELVSHLSEYLDGEADPHLLVKIERHLESCEDCRHCADEILTTVKVIRQNAYEAVPSEERERLRARLWASLG